MKTLVIAAHPTLETSRLNRTWLEELRKHPEHFTISSLYEKYPDRVIDIAQEQALIEAHDRIVLQFPFYWFNCPPLMKQWLDEVLLEGFAYGEGSWLFRDHNKTISLAVSVGVKEKDYHPQGEYLHEMSTLLLPFEMTARYLKSRYEPAFIQYGVNSRTSEAELQDSAERYVQHLLEAAKVTV